MLWSAASHEIWLPERVWETGDLETLRWIAGLEFFSMPWSFETSLYLPWFFLISFSLPLFLLHKSKGKGSQRAMAQFLYEAGWINRRNERALCLLPPFHKQMKIKSHVLLVFNSQTWNDRFPSGLACLLVHRPQCLEVMLWTGFALKLMRISHSLLLYSEEMENQHLNWRMSCISSNPTLQRVSCLYFNGLFIITEGCRDSKVCGCAPSCQTERRGPCSASIFLGLYYGSQWQGHSDWDIWNNKIRGCQHQVTEGGRLCC